VTKALKLGRQILLEKHSFAHSGTARYGRGWGNKGRTLCNKLCLNFAARVNKCLAFPCHRHTHTNTHTHTHTYTHTQILSLTYTDTHVCTNIRRTKEGESVKV